MQKTWQEKELSSLDPSLHQATTKKHQIFPCPLFPRQYALYECILILRHVREIKMLNHECVGNNLYTSTMNLLYFQLLRPLYHHIELNIYKRVANNAKIWAPFYILYIISKHAYQIMVLDLYVVFLFLGWATSLEVIFSLGYLGIKFPALGHVCKIKCEISIET